LIVGSALAKLSREDSSAKDMDDEEQAATTTDEENIEQEKSSPSKSEAPATYTAPTSPASAPAPAPTTAVSDSRFSNVTSAEVVSTLNVLPPIYRVFARGVYDKTCQYTASIDQTFTGRTFIITIKYSERSGLICLEKETEFEEKIILKGTENLSDGFYTVSVNGITTSFTK
jgi:hypothetical protein